MAIFLWFTPRRMALVMMALQLLWLALIWLTGAATAVYKLPLLLAYTLIIGLVVAFLPPVLVRRWHTAVVSLADRPVIGLMVIGIGFGLVGVYYAFQQRLWTFDEEASFAAAVTVARSGISGLMANYQNWGWLATQHPPLAPIVYGQFLWLVGPFLGQTLAVARLLSLLFAAGTGLLTYAIGAALYDKNTGMMAAGFLFTFPLFMRLSATTMVEPMLVFLFTLALYLTLLWLRRQHWFYLLALGLVVGLGLVTKYTMLFVGPIVLGFILWRGSRRQMWQAGGVLLLAGLLLAVVWGLVANRFHVLEIQLATITHYAGLTLTNTYGRNLLLETITNRLPSALGIYNLPLIALGGLMAVMRRSRSDWLVLLWVTAVWLPVLLTLPDHRYFMSSFPALAILMALLIRPIPHTVARSWLLSILYVGGTLYLFVDWMRAALLVLP